MFNFDDFSLVGKDLFTLGLVDPAGGSLSVRSEGKIFITKRNAMLAHLRPDDVIEVPLDAVNESDDQAAWEVLVHRAVYKETTFNAIVHAFPPYAIALSIGTENKIIPVDGKGQAALRSIPVVRAKGVIPGREKTTSDDIIKYLPPVFKSGYSAAVVKEYASFAAGADLMEAFKNTVALENSCKIIAISKSLSGGGVSSERNKRPDHPVRRTAIPPSIGVMGSSRGGRRGTFGGR
jgi:L-fuculose-phosphate aldolase